MLEIQDKRRIYSVAETYGISVAQKVAYTLFVRSRLSLQARALTVRVFRFEPGLLGSREVEYNLNGAPFPARSVASMEDADVGGARWEILLHESSCTNFYKGAFGWSEVHEVGSNGQEPTLRRYQPVSFPRKLNRRKSDQRRRRRSEG